MANGGLEIIGDVLDDLLDDMEGVGDDDDGDEGLDDLEGLGDYEDLEGLGDYDDDLLGARRGKKRRKKKAARRLLAAMAAKRGRAVKRSGFTRDRALILPFGQETVGTYAAVNALATMLANPQTPFRPRRLVISAVMAPVIANVVPIENIVITDIRVGKNSQLIATGSIPAAAFAGAANEMLFKFDTGRPGIVIAVEIQNVIPATTDITVTLAMVGYAAD